MSLQPKWHASVIIWITAMGTEGHCLAPEGDVAGGWVRGDPHPHLRPYLRPPAHLKRCHHSMLHCSHSLAEPQLAGQ